MGFDHAVAGHIGFAVDNYKGPVAKDCRVGVISDYIREWKK